MEDYDEYIGKKVVKKSERPFKSSFKHNTVKGIIIHPILNKPAFIFEEDDSFVAAFQCLLVK